MPQQCLTKPHTSTPRTPAHHLRKHENSLTLHLLPESGFSLQKKLVNINTCFYKHLLRHAWRWRQYCTLKTTLPWSWLHFSTSCDHQAVRSAATCFCVLKQSHTQPAQHRLTSKCGKNCIARNPAKKCCFIHSKTTASSQRGKKNPTELFFKQQPRGNRNISCMEKPGKLTKSSSLCEMKLPHQDLTH